MKSKRIWSLLLSLALVLGMLAGCDSAPKYETPEEAIAAIAPSELEEQELLYAAELGFPMDKLHQESITGAEMTALLDRLIEYAAPEKLEEWKALYPALRTSKVPLRRIDALSALFLALQHIGGDYGYFKTVSYNDPLFHSMMADTDAPNFDLFGGLIEYEFENGTYGHYGIGGYFYNITRKSPADGEYPMAYDEEAESFRMNALTTYKDALLAILRAIRLGESPSIAPVDDPAATTPNSWILTPELLQKAAKNPEVTSEDHPRWTGFVLNYTAAAGEINTSPKEMELSAEWGFNAARLFLPHTTVFSEDVTTVDVSALEKVDEMVAAAIKHDLHLDIMLSSLPGRNVDEAGPMNDFISTAELDLFINEEKQAMADRLFQILAKRYKDVPNFNLSFAPFYETQNKDLSTGLPAPEYTEKDVAAYLDRVIDVIRAEDPDRLIVYEATATNPWDAIIPESAPAKKIADEKGNAIISYNFCETPYVYACMTVTEGYHIDNMNSSMYLPNYPNYVYSVNTHIRRNHPLILDGLLPEGTEMTLHLAQSDGGNLSITADDEVLYSEKLPKETYETGNQLSGLYPYAQSEKQISVTLPFAPEELTISCKGGSFELSGVLLTLPPEYAVERWYYVQRYDVYLGLEQEEGVRKQRTSQVMISPGGTDEERITIQDDLTYTSGHIYQEASPETIARWSDEIMEFDGNCIIRFERATFSGTTWAAMSAYYEDLLQSFEEHGFGWFSNDWWLMTEEWPQTNIIAECPSTEYAGYEHFNLELLELLQKYQSKD